MFSCLYHILAKCGPRFSCLRHILTTCSLQTGLVDYDKLEETALVFRPKMLICGASAYPRDFDYKRLRSIADKVGAYLLADMAHVSGLVAAEVR